MSRRQIWIEGRNGVSVGVYEGDPLIDSEGVCVWEPLGYAMFAFWPVRCRNGKWRWFCGVDRHRDGTYTKSSGRW
jgi:hypothetical protein